MSQGPNEPSTDLIRWSFTVNPTFCSEIEDHLDGLGADVLVRDRRQFLVSWDEPSASLDGVIEAIWAINGEPFEVTQEDFHRVGLHTLHHEDGDAARDAA